MTKCCLPGARKEGMKGSKPVTCVEGEGVWHKWWWWQVEGSNFLLGAEEQCIWYRVSVVLVLLVYGAPTRWHCFAFLSCKNTAWCWPSCLLLGYRVLELCFGTLLTLWRRVCCPAFPACVAAVGRREAEGVGWLIDLNVVHSALPCWTRCFQGSVQ